MREPGWQAATVERLAAALRPDTAVRALLVAGSWVHGTADAWSDLDLVVVVADGQLERCFPSLDWLRPLGEIFGLEQYPGPERAATRLCLDDGRRIDLVVVTEAGLENDTNWPFAAGVQIPFARSATVERVLARPASQPVPKPLTEQQFDSFVGHFWFGAVAALGKVARDDLLIALHLSLAAIEDTCVLGMMLRDRATGTTVHHTGGMGNDVARRVRAPASPPSASSILDSLADTATLFDELAGQWSTTYQARAPVFCGWVEAARTARSATQ